MSRMRRGIATVAAAETRSLLDHAANFHRRSFSFLFGWYSGDDHRVVAAAQATHNLDLPTLLSTKLAAGFAATSGIIGRASEISPMQRIAYLLHGATDPREAHQHGAGYCCFRENKRLALPSSPALTTPKI